MEEGESGLGWGKVLPFRVPSGDMFLSTLKGHLLSITALESMVNDKCGLSGCVFFCGHCARLTMRTMMSGSHLLLTDFLQ